MNGKAKTPKTQAKSKRSKNVLSVEERERRITEIGESLQAKTWRDLE